MHARSHANAHSKMVYFNAAIVKFDLLRLRSRLACSISITIPIDFQMLYAGIEWKVWTACCASLCASVWLWCHTYCLHSGSVAHCSKTPFSIYLIYLQIKSHQNQQKMSESFLGRRFSLWLHSNKNDVEKWLAGGHNSRSFSNSWIELKNL